MEFSLDGWREGWDGGTGEQANETKKTGGVGRLKSDSTAVCLGKVARA